MQEAGKYVQFYTYEYLFIFIHLHPYLYLHLSSIYITSTKYGSDTVLTALLKLFHLILAKNLNPDLS